MEPVSFGLATALLAIVTLCAGILPVLRASRVDPSSPCGTSRRTRRESVVAPASA
jgi:hypothetical protein